MRAILFASAAVMIVLGLSTVSVSYRTVARVEERINLSLRALEQDRKLASLEDGQKELFRHGPYFDQIEPPWQWAMLGYFFGAAVMLMAAVRWPKRSRDQLPGSPSTAADAGPR